MTIKLTIKASTTDAELETIRFVDMRVHAREQRDDAARVREEQGDQTVLEYHDVDGVNVLYSPTFGYAYVNEYSPGVGDSHQIDNGEAKSAEHAASVWRGGPLDDSLPLGAEDGLYVPSRDH